MASDSKAPDVEAINAIIKKVLEACPDDASRAAVLATVGSTTAQKLTALKCVPSDIANDRSRWEKLLRDVAFAHEQFVQQVGAAMGLDPQRVNRLASQLTRINDQVTAALRLVNPDWATDDDSLSKRRETAAAVLRDAARAFASQEKTKLEKMHLADVIYLRRQAQKRLAANLAVGYRALKEAVDSNEQRALARLETYQRFWSGLGSGQDVGLGEYEPIDAALVAMDFITDVWERLVPDRIRPIETPTQQLFYTVIPDEFAGTWISPLSDKVIDAIWRPELAPKKAAYGVAALQPGQDSRSLRQRRVDEEEPDADLAHWLEEPQPQRATDILVPTTAKRAATIALVASLPTRTAYHVPAYSPEAEIRFEEGETYRLPTTGPGAWVRRYLVGASRPRRRRTPVRKRS
ncbi:MAG: hypothetical protein KC503_37690 [Myxococcales bacterium]|nr:hypothetical protein [Myxococcales bacterium]